MSFLAVPPSTEIAPSAAGGKISRYSCLGFKFDDCFGQAFHISADAGILYPAQVKAILMNQAALFPLKRSAVNMGRCNRKPIPHCGKIE